MVSLAANMEWLFTEAGVETAARVRAAGRHGFRDVELWGWREKDLPAVRDAAREAGVRILSVIVDPQLQLTDRGSHEAYLAAVAESVRAADVLGSPNLVVVAGQGRDGVSREDQRAAVVSVLREAAALVPDHLTLLLENLNDRVDHPGTFLTSTIEALDIIDEVGSPRLKLLLDAYHALVMGEDPVDLVGARMSSVGHVQIADVPGRHEPGTGTVDWPELLRSFVAAGYAGPFGLECMPSGSTEQSLREIERIAAEIS
jgi:hydroxypyruvate isomerase